MGWFLHDYGLFGPGWVMILVLITMPILVLAIFSLLLFWPVALGTLKGFVERHNESRWFLTSAVAVVLGFGGGLFLLRQHMRMFYAIAELSGAAAVAWSALGGRYESGLVFAVTLMGAVYLVVRGIDNMSQFSREESIYERVFSSSESLSAALNKGVTDTRSEDKRANRTTQGFVVLGQEITIHSGQLEYRVRVDHRYTSMPTT
jgi:hypothetical protein